MSVTATFTVVCFLILVLLHIYKSNHVKELLQHGCKQLGKYVV